MVGPGNFKPTPLFSIAGEKVRYITSVLVEFCFGDTAKYRFGLLKLVTVILGFLKEKLKRNHSLI